MVNNNKTINICISLMIYFLIILTLHSKGIINIEVSSIKKHIFLFPVGILVATVAMSSGISGSNFWVPIYIGIMEIEPRVSFWLALSTMLFGFGSGVIKNIQMKSIRFDLIKLYIIPAILGAIIGASIQPYVQTKWLLIGFAIFVASYGLHMITSKEINENANEVFTIPVIFIGGTLKGMIATGLGKLMLLRLLRHKNTPSQEVIGTTVFIVFIANVITIAVIPLQNEFFLDGLINDWSHLLNIMIFVAPGVIIGGQIGPPLTRNISKTILKKYVGLLLLLISYFMLMRGVNM